VTQALIKSQAFKEKKLKEPDVFESIALRFFEECSYSDQRLTAILLDFLQYKDNEKIISFDEIFPLQGTLAKRAKCSTKTVQRFLRKLKEFGLELEQRRTRRGRFSSNEFTFDKDFKRILFQFRRLKLFNNIQNKEKYKKYIKRRLAKVRGYLDRNGSFDEVFKMLDRRIEWYKKGCPKKTKTSMKMSYGGIGYIKSRNPFYRKDTKRRFVHNKFENWQISGKEKRHFSNYSEHVIQESLRSFEWWLNQPGKRIEDIRELNKFFQQIINRVIARIAA
jgi:hypothetical protein